MPDMKKFLSILLVLIALTAAACSKGDDPATAQDAQSAADSASGLAEFQAFGAGQQPGGASGGDRQSTLSPLTEAPSGGVFRRLWADPPTLDPHLATDTASAGLVVEIFSGLVALNTDLQLIPDIAESWQVENGVVYTFKLRPNVKFHNGKPVTAHDFKWSLERAAAPKTASPVADTYLNDIVGAVDYIEGRANEITGVKVIDDLTLQITADAPKAYFLAKLTYPTAYVLDQETVEAGGRNWWVVNPVGTGPFILDEYRIGERIILRRNDDYYREPANIELIHMNLAGGQAMAMYENDEIDITGVSLFDLERVLDPNDALNKELVVAPPQFTVSYIGFNTNMNPFDDSKFRQALNHAIDKDLIAKEVLSDLVTPAYSILPPGFPGYDANIRGLTYNPDLARQLLKESKYADPAARNRITITVPGTGGTIGLDLEVIIEMWKQVLDVEVEIQQVEWATYLKDLDKQKFQAFAGLGWQADYPDPQDFLDILFHSESGLNHGGYSNPNVDAVLEKARTEPDVVNRVSLYNQAEQIIVDDAAWVPLWFQGERHVLIKPQVKGYKLIPMIVPKLTQVHIEG